VEALSLNPILKALSSMSGHGVNHLLMGGQACVLYGAAEFSKDTDLLILSDPGNLARLQKALDELQAHQVAVPPFREEYLERGHAIHFRCQAEGVQGLRIDVMSRMRGVETFEQLWLRRSTLELPEQEQKVELLGLEDLVKAKKTQREKDWPMITRLLEAHYFQNRKNVDRKKVLFWLREMRTPSLLQEVTLLNPPEAAEIQEIRPLLAMAREGKEAELFKALDVERQEEMERDRLYWLPLRRELEEIRLGR
jgi:hypothetical protein